MSGPVHERHDASAALTGHAIPGAQRGAYLDDLRDDCGLVVGRVLEVVRALTHRDLLAELIEPIAGDFETISSMRAGWHDVSRCLHQVGRNYEALSHQLPPFWEGHAARAAGSLLTRAADVHERQSEAASLVGEQLDHVLEVSTVTAELVCAVLDYLDSIVQQLLLEAALGPFGWAEAAASAPGKIARMLGLVDRGSHAVSELERLADTVSSLLAHVQDFVTVASLAASVVEGVAHGVAADGAGAASATGW